MKKGFFVRWENNVNKSQLGRRMRGTDRPFEVGPWAPAPDDGLQDLDTNRPGGNCSICDHACHCGRSLFGKLVVLSEFLKTSPSMRGILLFLFFYIKNWNSLA